MFDTKDISQYRIIQKSRHFFGDNYCNVAEGMCNGLVFLAIEYFLLNKKDEFFKDLYQFIQLDDVSSFYLMLTRLLILFIPKQFSLDLTQDNAYQLLNPKPICQFSFGMVMSKKNWVKFFNQVNLRENEVMRVASINHVVMITKKNNQYYLYDPNCSEGEMQYSNASGVVNGLSWSFDSYPLLTNKLAMTVNIFTSARELEIKRDVDKFYKTFIDEKTSKVLFKQKEYDSLIMSIMANQPDCLEIFKDNISEDTLSWAIVYGADLIVDQLLLNWKFLEAEMLQKNLSLALLCGQFKIFNGLLKNDEFHHQFIQTLVPYFKKILIENAIQGGNVDLFRQIMTVCHADKTPGQLLVHDLKFRGSSDYSRATLLVKKAIESPQIEILTELLKYLTEQGIRFNQSEIKHLTLVAIENNYLTALMKILETSDAKQLSQLSLSIEMIYSCSKPMIAFLKEKGAHLNPWQEYCLKVKDSAVLSFVLYIYIYSLLMIRFLLGLEKNNGLYFDETITHVPHPS